MNVNWHHLPMTALAALLWSAPAHAQPAGVQYGDPCSMITCPDNSTCMFTNVGAVCNCDWGFAPDGSGGCKHAECTKSDQCGRFDACVDNKCVRDEQKIRDRKVGLGLLVPGIVLTAAGTGLIGASIYFRVQARHCTNDPFLGLPVCTVDRGSTDYRLFQIFMITGVIMGGTGLALLIVGAVKLGRTRSVILAEDGPRLVPWLSAIPGGAVAGIGGTF